MVAKKDAAGHRIVTAAALIAVAFGIGGCSSNDDDEMPALVEESSSGEGALEEDSGSVDSYDDYTGVYDREFYDDVEFYVGTEVTVSAIVDEVISPNVFTVIDNANSDEQTEDPVDIDEVVIEPLLVVHEQDIPGLAPGTPVGVVGTVREEFYLATVENELGVDLDDPAFERWEEQAYIEATEAGAMTAGS
ncbi:hypothetical protein E8P82_10495 [Arthrobacter echini]|uniref:Uncharacterized protein n=1 Tax=Arthrobacter echini TaxID=1529066 RepID=A0A4S5E3U0_9MICC|nr:hypothetical protein [Arthrobacter echini]THJ66050.1 hypothetical protein E8P82_10495 [Arthrobacter echini]